MSLNVLKGCKRYIIQRINNPGSYLVVESENEIYSKRKIKRLERSLASHVVRLKDTRKLRIGKMVAVRDDKGFHRGKITDIFNRSCRTMYLVLLIDSGNTVEIHEENIYLIKNQKFREEIPNSIEITVHGIQPAALDLNYDNPNSDGIFQIRKCDEWSEGAYKFVKNLFMNDPYIFVKIINPYKTTSCEIYFTQDTEIVSLGQKLCDEGFAILCNTPEKCINNHSHSGNFNKEIEEKIPANALSSDFELRKTFMKLSLNNVNRLSAKAVPSQESSPVANSTENDSSSSPSKKTVCENTGSVLSHDSSNCSASKKSLVNTKSSSDSNKTPNEEDEPTENKLNVCRIVLRNLKIFNQSKHMRGEHNQN